MTLRSLLVVLCVISAVGSRADDDPLDDGSNFDPMEDAKKEMKDMDTDGDGKVTRVEMRAFIHKVRFSLATLLFRRRSGPFRQRELRRLQLL